MSIRRHIGAGRSALAQFADRLKRGRWYRPSPENADVDLHLKEAVEWIKRAQDAGGDRGVSYGADFGGPFMESYPETTGYIIPTCVELAQYYGDESLLARAVEMGNWESAVQMECGAVMGGRINLNPTPAVFNTGMVLLGWSALYRKTGKSAFLNSLQRASRWLVDMQAADGNWTKGNSQFAFPSATVYNVKAAWGLCEAGRAMDMSEAVAGAVKNADYCLTKQSSNGWFSDCCLTDPSQPLTHTLAYSMQGLIGIGANTDRQDFITAAARTADSFIDLIDERGFIPGRIGPDFRGTVNWCCLTGTAQIALVWGNLYRLTGKPKYRSALIAANKYLTQRHDILNADPALRGGMPGSWPVWGDYGRFKILNWATNFFIESLLMQKKIEAASDVQSEPLKKITEDGNPH